MVAEPYEAPVYQSTSLPVTESPSHLVSQFPSHLVTKKNALNYQSAFRYDVMLNEIKCQT